jgi:hypothetical protein
VPAVPSASRVSYTTAATPRGRDSTHHRAVVRRGWLEKKGGDTHIDTASNILRKERHYAKGGRRTWKPRWFILYADGELAYFSAVRGNVFLRCRFI